MIRPLVLTAALMSLAGVAQAQFPSAGGITEGQEVCVFGFIMDFFCVDRGTLLDAPDVVTLLNPELHSLHCLLDVPSCYESPYHILEPPAEGATEYGTGWQVSNNTMLLDVGRQQGSVALGCTTCPGEGTLQMGFRAEVTGTVTSLDPTPIIDVTNVVNLADGATGCAATDDAPAPAPADAPAPAPADGNATETPAATDDAPAATEAPSAAITAAGINLFIATMVGAVAAIMI